MLKEMLSALKWTMSLVESLKPMPLTFLRYKTIPWYSKFLFSKLGQLMFSSTLKYKKQFYTSVQGFYVGDKIRIIF